MAGSEHTFLFADLIGFTSLTERCGDELAADLALEFARDAEALAGEYGCTLVKTLGDAVMIHGTDPDAVVALGTRLAAGGRRNHWVLHVRIGIHTGPAVSRGEDWYGATVNVASRLSEAAGQDEVLLSDVTRARIAEAAPVRAAHLAARGSRPLKNVAAPLTVYAAA